MSLLEFKKVERRFPLKRSLVDVLANRDQVYLHAVRGVDLSVKQGEILGIVGESGCGKSTLARIGVGLQPSNGGHVVFDGKPLDGPDRAGRERCPPAARHDCRGSGGGRLRSLPGRRGNEENSSVTPERTPPLRAFVPPRFFGAGRFSVKAPC